MQEEATMTDRTVLRITGADREDFLQGLVTNDVKKLSEGLVYAALLTPQGKYIADFFLAPDQDAILIDVATLQAASLAQRLNMYRLRADVKIETTDIAQTHLKVHSLTHDTLIWAGAHMTGEMVRAELTGTSFAWPIASHKQVSSLHLTVTSSKPGLSG